MSRLELFNTLHRTGRGLQSFLALLQFLKVLAKGAFLCCRLSSQEGSPSTDLVKRFLGGGAELQALINEKVEISLTNVCWDFSTKFRGNNRPL